MTDQEKRSDATEATSLPSKSETLSGDSSADTQAGADGEHGGIAEPAPLMAEISKVPAPQPKPAKGKGEHHRKHAESKTEAGPEPAEEEAARLREEVETLRSEIKDLKDRWLRSLADFDNYRKRLRKEWELLQQRSRADLILSVLSVVDDFERAFSVVGDKDDDFIQGIRLIYNKLTAVLEEAGVRKIEALGTAFDPTYHMAVAQVEREGSESHHVVEVAEEGYCLGDIVIRPAKVVIAK
jgi:molecular chaperone GrpE